MSSEDPTVPVAESQLQEDEAVAEEQSREQKLLSAFDFGAHPDMSAFDIARTMMKTNSKSEGVLPKIIHNRRAYGISDEDAAVLKAISEEIKDIRNWWEETLSVSDPTKKNSRADRAARCKAFAEKNLPKLKEIFAHAQTKSQEASQPQQGPAAAKVQIVDSPAPSAQPISSAPVRRPVRRPAAAAGLGPV